MEIPDMLDNMPRECGDCEHFQSEHTYRSTGTCDVRDDLLLQDESVNGLPRPIRIQVVLRAIECAQDCPHFEWAIDSRRALEAAVADGYLVTPVERRL